MGRGRAKEEVEKKEGKAPGRERLMLELHSRCTWWLSRLHEAEGLAHGDSLPGW